jgi:hypothetical protein
MEQSEMSSNMLMAQLSIKAEHQRRKIKAAVCNKGVPNLAPSNHVLSCPSSFLVL